MLYGERPTGRHVRMFMLPSQACDLRRVKAKLSSGVLQVVFAKVLVNDATLCIMLQAAERTKSKISCILIVVQYWNGLEQLK